MAGSSKQQKASHPNWSFFLPKVILASDLPITKRSKQPLRTVAINKGLHWHGLTLVDPLTPKLDIPLDLYIQANRDKYLAGSIQQIPVKPLTHRRRNVTSYGMKVFKRIQFSGDDVLLFARSISELPTNEQLKKTRR
jgi:hypothetical protein